MGKNKEKFGVKIRPPSSYQPVVRKKKGLSTAMKVLIGLALIVIVVVAASVALSPPANQVTQVGYPVNVAPVNYALSTFSADGKTVTLPTNYVNSSKLVFVDLKLKNPVQILPYQSRSVPLLNYRNGDYLPLVIISTPSGNTVSGIRTCEPCGSFSFHIVKGANLKCDVCGAEWKLEDFAPVSGGCATYPPPKLPTTVNGDSVNIDLSALGLELSA